MLDTGSLVSRAALLLVACLVAPAGRSAAPELAGTWLPVDELSTPFPSPLPLTPEARERFEAFDPDRDEPAGFCMPLGTPRNTLAGTGPMEVLQADDRVYFIFQPNLLNAETRRVYLFDRELPPKEDRLPTWLGLSRGRFEGEALLVETTELEPQAILNGDGLSHGGGLVVRERWRIEQDPRRGRLLVDDIVLDDPASFTAPITLRRVFAWAPDARLAAGQCSEGLWIDRLWRHRLAEHAAARREAEAKARAPRAGGAK
jgi:hypothetical protein